MSDTIKKLLKAPDINEFINQMSIDELESAITYSADKYYNTNKPVIKDVVYDTLFDFLQYKAPKSKVLKTIGAKVKSKNKVKLDYWTGSMDKIKPNSSSLTTWISKYKCPYHLSDKLDGISALIIYRNDKTINMYSRGTSSEGIDISELLKYINIPSWDSVNSYVTKNKLVGTINMFALRGELIMKNTTFNTKWASTFKNPRNTIAGLVNSKKINPKLALDTDLIVYEIVDPVISIEDQMRNIKQLNFTSVNYKITDTLSFNILSKYFLTRRTKSDYQLDGIIITTTELYKRNKIGNPDYAFAYKDILEEQKAITKIIDIEWNTSKDGYIIPTLILEPCAISGVEIKRVTGNNARNVVDNKLGIGGQVEIIRSGDVIPKIINVLKPGKVELPKGDWSWSSTNIDIILNNSNVDVIKKNIYYFFSTLEARGLGEKVINKLYNAGFNSVPIILGLTEELLTNANIDSFKEKTINNLIKSIRACTNNITLAQIMVASNKLGHGLGIERMKQIISTMPNILTDYKQLSQKEFILLITKIDGFDTKTATLFVSHFEDFIIFYKSIKKYIKLKETIIKTGKFANKIFVFSSFRDKELQNEIELQGGKVTSSVSKNTSYLIIKDRTAMSTKITKAQELGIKVITKNELLALLL
jgi:NAD-dependent DNA ligase